MPERESSQLIESERVSRWLASLETRYRGGLTRPELLKATRALSARYVESRADLPTRSTLDSAGKRAAFAMFYAPLHFLTVRAAVRALEADRADVHSILDLGCGTGSASAAWTLALEAARPGAAQINGIDSHSWAVNEAAWTWSSLRVDGRARRGDLVDAFEHSLADRRRSAQIPAILLAWSANELGREKRARMAAAVVSHIDRGGAVLVIEPISRRATPWWHEWVKLFIARNGRADDWTFETALPSSIQDLNDSAGFGPRTLTARTLWCAPAVRA